jgi:hypothetical protein
MTGCIPRLRSSVRLGCAALAVVAVASAPARASKSQTSGPAAGPLVDLASTAQLRDQFNADRGKVRLVLLLSPT